MLFLYLMIVTGFTFIKNAVKYQYPIVEAIESILPLCDEVVVAVGSVNIIVTKKRKPYHKEIDFTRLGLKPRESDIVVVKIGYLEPELYAMQKGWMLALTPGGVDQKLERLDYKRIKRPMFPKDKDMADPDLSAKLIPNVR